MMHLLRLLTAIFSAYNVFAVGINGLYDSSLPEPSITLKVRQRKNDPSRRRNLIGTSQPAIPTSPLPRISPLNYGSELLPLYPGYGTHIAYIYIGTPPRRQSVIIDTGSHYTAFPCKGCTQCGAHTDPYFDPDASSTHYIPKCNGSPCVFSQSYSEGSSWKAYKVVDKLWVGGIMPALVPNATKYTTDFSFGCQTSETGLFRTQLADGIMGMSNSPDTLAPQLFATGVTQSKIFSLCYRVGGGIMTLGGADQRIHSKPIQFAKLARMANWYTLNLLNVMLEDQVTGFQKKVTSNMQPFNMGKGAIIDSGTTDTYFPASAEKEFSALFMSIADIPYTTGGKVTLTPSQLRRVPNVIFFFENVDPNGPPVQVRMPWTSFVENAGNGGYAFRIFLTEGTGTVLGANFMTGNNIVFDVDSKRIGFAESTCRYEDYVKPQLPTGFLPHLPPHIFPPPAVSNASNTGQQSCPTTPRSACTADCSQDIDAYDAKGTQEFVDG